MGFFLVPLLGYAFIFTGIFVGALAARDVARQWRGIAGGWQIAFASLITLIVSTALTPLLLAAAVGAPPLAVGLFAFAISCGAMTLVAMLFLFFSEDRRESKVAPPAPPVAPHHVDRLDRRDGPDRVGKDDDGQLRATR